MKDLSLGTQFSALWRRIIKSPPGRLITACLRSGVPARSASVALFSVISLFPVIALLVWTAGLQGDALAARNWISNLGPYIPPDIVQMINDEIAYRESVGIKGSGSLVVWHVGVLIFSAGAAARSLLFGFRSIAGAGAEIGLANIFGRSILFVLTVLAFTVIASTLVGAMTYLVSQLTGVFASSLLTALVQWLVMTGILALVLNVLYMVSLFGHHGNKISGWAGAALAASLIAALTLALITYTSYAPSNAERYGQPGYIINVLLWFYASAYCLLAGAQLNALISVRSSH